MKTLSANSDLAQQTPAIGRALSMIARRSTPQGTSTLQTVAAETVAPAHVSVSECRNKRCLAAL